MTTPFKNTLRSLAREPRRLTTVGVSVLACLAVAWLAAALLVPVPVHVISTQARLITAKRPMPMHSPVALPVKHLHVDIGDRVEAGQLLVELDGGALPIEIEQARESLAAATREITALRQQQRSRITVIQRNDESVAAEGRRTLAELTAADDQLALANADWERSRRLGADGVLSEANLEQRQAAVSEARGRVAALQASLDFQRAQALLYEEEQRVALAAITQFIAERQIDMATSRGKLQILLTAFERTKIAAPVGGTIGALADVSEGAVVDNAEWLLTLVPDTTFEVEAHFDARALGQLRKGQLGRLRLDSFPWATYGLVATKLSRLGADASNELTLARFEIEPNAASSIPLQNGLVGQLEVEVRRVPAAVLLLEVLGRLGVNQA